MTAVDGQGERWPRGLRRPSAAEYIGVGVSKFDEMVKDGRMPGPKLVDECVVWDRRRLDDAFDNLPDREKKLDRARWRAKP